MVERLCRCEKLMKRNQHSMPTIQLEDATVCIYMYTPLPWREALQSELTVNRSDVHLLDLPDEISLIILEKLHNIDVFHCLLNINNERLNILAQENIFSNTQFCIDILLKIRHNVKCFILESVSMECILLAIDYPNLTELKIFNFEQKIALSYFPRLST